MVDWLIQLGSVVGGAALTGIVMAKIFVGYLERKDLAEEETKRQEREQLISLLEKQVIANQQVAVLNEKVAIVIDKLLRNGNGKH